MGRLNTCAAGVFVIFISTTPLAADSIDGWKTDRLEGASTVVYHQAVIFPRIAENNLVFECINDTLKVDVIGFQPLQKFPQPDLKVHLGDSAFSRTATATFVKASKPSGPINMPQEKLDDNLKGKNLSWPGHPAYSRLSIKMWMSEEFFTAFAKSEPVKLTFADQKMSFPELDKGVAERFVELCKAKVPGALIRKTDRSDSD